MANYSISATKVEQKSDMTEGTLAPNAGSVELRVDDSGFSSKLDFWTTLERMLERVREQNQPRP